MFADLASPISLIGTLDGMRITIDRAGRIVIPKNARELLGLEGGGEVELSLAADRIEIASAPRAVSLRRGPHGVLTSDLDLPEQGPDEVRDALERARR
jgi:AbrB family looped-hinge helix DNA binding protein